MSTHNKTAEDYGRVIRWYERAIEWEVNRIMDGGEIDWDRLTALNRDYQLASLKNKQFERNTEDVSCEIIEPVMIGELLKVFGVCKFTGKIELQFEIGNDTWETYCITKEEAANLISHLQKQLSEPLKIENQFK